jgi:hypothetical protein
MKSKVPKINSWGNPRTCVHGTWSTHPRNSSKKGEKILLAQAAFTKKKFWEELIVYFPFTVILLSHTASRNKILVCMPNEVNKTTQFNLEGCNVAVTGETDEVYH